MKELICDYKEFTKYESLTLGTEPDWSTLVLTRIWTCKSWEWQPTTLFVEPSRPLAKRLFFDLCTAAIRVAWGLHETLTGLQRAQIWVGTAPGTYTLHPLYSLLHSVIPWSGSYLQWMNHKPAVFVFTMYQTNKHVTIFCDILLDLLGILNIAMQLAIDPEAS